MAAPTIHSTTTPAAGGSSTSNASTAVGDLVIVFTWERAGAGVPTHTLDSAGGYVTIQSISHNDGSTDGRLSVAYKVATSNGAVAYQAYTTSTGSPVWWTGLMVLDTGTYDETTINSAQVTATGTGVPNPPNITNMVRSRDYLVAAISAWHLTASQTLTPTHSVMTLKENVAGAATGDVALATITQSGVESYDPGAWGDNQTPNGTCSVSLAVPNPVTFGGVRQARSQTAGDTIAYPFNVKTGNLLIAVHDWASGDTPSISDSIGHTYAVAVEQEDAGTGFGVTAHYAIATSSAANTVSPTPTISGTASFYQILEFEGPFAASPLDDTASAIGTSTTPNSGTVTPSVDGCIIVGFGIGANAITVAGGFTVDDAEVGASDFQHVTHSLQTTATSDTADWTMSSGYWIAMAAVFKPEGSAAFELDIGSGAYVITGAAVGLLAARTISAVGGTYAITGAPVSFIHGYNLAAAGGSYAITGADVTLFTTRQIIAAGGSYSIIGADVALQVTRTVIAGSGVYAITGADVEFILGHSIVAAGGTYAITGADVSLLAARQVIAAGGAYLITGADVAFQYDRIFIVEGGVYTITGADVSLDYVPTGTFVLTADGGTYVITGTAAGLFVARQIIAGSGAYFITGNPLTSLVWSGSSPSGIGKQSFMPIFRTRRGR